MVHCACCVSQLCIVAQQSLQHPDMLQPANMCAQMLSMHEQMLKTGRSHVAITNEMQQVKHSWGQTGAQKLEGCDMRWYLGCQMKVLVRALQSLVGTASTIQSVADS